LTITAASTSMVYGAPLPTLTASYTGLVNGDTAGSLTTSPTLSTTATATSPPGTYPITASGAVDPNYTITYVPGTLTIQPAAFFLQAAAASSDGRVPSLSAGSLTTAAGDLLIAAVAWDTTSSSVMSVSDSEGNAWTTATTRQVDTRNAQALQVFYAPNIAGGSDTVTIVPSPAALWVRVIVHEVTGAAPSAPLDQTAVNNAGSGTSISVGPVTTAAAGEYLFTAAMNDGAVGSASLSAGSGCTLRAAVASGDSALASADQVQSAAGSISAAWTLSQSADSMAQTASFKAAGAASGSGPAIRSLSASLSTITAGQSGHPNVVVAGGANPPPPTRVVKTPPVAATVAAETGVGGGLSRNLAIRNLGNGSVAISGRGAPGGTYLIEYCADSEPATNWLTLGAVTADASGAFVLVENLGPGRRFYRAVNP